MMELMRAVMMVEQMEKKMAVRLVHRTVQIVAD